MLKTIVLPLLFIFSFTACFDPTPPTALKNTYWSLTELHDKDAQHFEHQAEIHLIFHINNNSLHGSDGCNLIYGKYSKDKNNFSIDEISKGEVVCKEGMEQANEFLHILTKTDRIKIVENNLIFYHADIEIARFEAKEDY